MGLRAILTVTGKESELALGPSREAGGLGAKTVPSRTREGGGGWAWGRDPGGGGGPGLRAGGRPGPSGGGLGASCAQGWISACAVAAAAPGAAPLPALPPELFFCPAL